MQIVTQPIVHRRTWRLHYGWVVLTLIVLAIFCSLGLGRFGYTSILPAMQDSLKLTNTQTGVLQSWNLAGYLITVVFAGMLATRYGPRWVISISLLVTCGAMVLTGLVPTFRAAQLGRFLAGVGGAGGNVPAMALISAWFGPKRRGMASGIGVAGSSLGLMVTGPLTPAILNYCGPQGWRIYWYVLGTMTLIIFFLVALFLRNRPETMGLTKLGQSELESNTSFSARGSSLSDWGHIYQSRGLWHLAIIYLAFGLSYIIYATFFTRYLVKEGGFTLHQAGSLWLNVGFVSIISGFIWGSLSDAWGRRIAMLSVFILQGLSFLLFGLSTAALMIYLSVGLFALTAWSIPALMAALAGDIFGARFAPAALGLMTIIFGFGQAAGPYLAGRMADATHSFAPAFVLAGLVALILGAGGTWCLPKSRYQN